MIIRMLGISPETLVDSPRRSEEEIYKNIEQFVNLIPNEDVMKAIEENTTVAANGMRFKKNKKGLIPKAVAIVFNKRVNYKNEMKVHAKRAEAIKAELDRRNVSY